jgi:hypothetical protein
MPTDLLDRLASLRDAAAALPVDVAGIRRLSDDELVRWGSLAAGLQQSAGIQLALVAGEIARRSATHLGHDGLAQRGGFRTAEALVRDALGTTARDASTAVRVGRVLVDTVPAADPLTGTIDAPTHPWLRDVAAALVAGALSVAEADAIRAGLGSPGVGVDEVALTDAAGQLCAEAAAHDPDSLFRRSRQLRDDIDDAGVAERERARRE